VEEVVMDKKLFDKIWEETEDVFDGVQVIESKVIDRAVKYYVFPYRDGVPIITLHDDEWRIMSDRKLHKQLIGEIINEITKSL
tara:strand:- start:50 stop:298 length:249 start_codon:yes stop_codon:yes gene_type:complete